MLTRQFEVRLNRLKKLDSPIKHLFYSGVDLSEFDGKALVAIVGTRKPTPYGLHQTQKIASELSRAGVVVVSGLALGVDAVAHQATLESDGYCVAVLPSDVDHPYPATNRPLAKKIIDSKKGTLVSEYDDNKRPKKVDFLIRNRIVSALSDAIIITEAAAQSGTLNTARHAREMGIPVFAVPGALNSPMSAGCNWLVQQGAYLLSDTNQVFELLGIDNEPQQKLDLSSNSPKQTIILQKIAHGHVFTDDLVTETGLQFSDLQAELTVLEIEGRIRQNAYGSWDLI